MIRSSSKSSGEEALPYFSEIIGSRISIRKKRVFYFIIFFFSKPFLSLSNEQLAIFFATDQDRRFVLFLLKSFYKVHRFPFPSWKWLAF